MGKQDTCIPSVLSDRIILLRSLDSAYDLLESIANSNVSAKAEIQFVQERIDSIEAELEESVTEAEQIINLMRYDPVLWTICRLRFLQGYEWKQAAAAVGITGEAGRMKAYRFFKSMSTRPTKKQ